VYLEIESVDGLRGHLAHNDTLDGVVFQGLDLRAEGPVLRSLSAAGACFLGCTLDPQTLAHVYETGGLVFPALPDVPYAPYRPTLYTPDALCEGYVRGRPETCSLSFDQRVFAHYEAARLSGKVPIIEALAQRIHDHAIDDALRDYLRQTPEKKIVAVMGGHGMLRTDAAYRTVARIGLRLTALGAGYVVATGGGPGAMEAANLGAYLAPFGEAALDEALAMMADAKWYRAPGWWETALAVRDRFPGGGESLGIPTWHYGHEPPNLFASHVAKYFANSIREEGLLAIAHHGVIYAPGSAGTIQEVFMDAAQNHYASFGFVSPMVFLDRTYWTEVKPVYPLLQTLAAGKLYGELLAVVDDVDCVVAHIQNHPPRPR
jgi:predicted Rossmann-fold nucleotide-binding protein